MQNKSIVLRLLNISTNGRLCQQNYIHAPRPKNHIGWPLSSSSSARHISQLLKSNGKNFGSTMVVMFMQCKEQFGTTFPSATPRQKEDRSKKKGCCSLQYYIIGFRIRTTLIRLVGMIKTCKEKYFGTYNAKGSDSVNF